MTRVTKFPSWAPKLLCEKLQNGDYDHNPFLVETTNRLLTYPEMEVVWRQYIDWVQKAFDFSKKIYETDRGRDLRERFCYQGLFRVAVNSISEFRKAAVMSPKKKMAALDQVVKHAKQLRHSLDRLGMPDNILRYFPEQTVFEVVQTSTLELYKHAIRESTFVEPAELNHMLNCFIEYAQQESALQIENKTAFGLRELLKILADLANDEDMIFMLPATIVQQAKGGNAARLYLIRSCARLIKVQFDCSPIKEKRFISNFTRTVLDDPEVNEDVVKDALRGYKLPKYIDFRNKEEN